MSNLIGRGLAIALLAVMLAVPWAFNRWTVSGVTVSKPEASLDGALARYGFHLKEVSRDVGIDFVHEAPKLDPKLDHIMTQIASMGAESWKRKEKAAKIARRIVQNGQNARDRRSAQSPTRVRRRGQRSCRIR